MLAITFIQDPLDKLKDDIKSHLKNKMETHTNEVINSQEFQSQLKFLTRFTQDFIFALRSVSSYSTRGKEIYDNFLTIRSIDDLLQSAIGILVLTQNGIHNTVRRELRYLIEMTTKYVIVDYEQMGKPLLTKTQYLTDQIPNSSIEVIDRYTTPFSEPTRKEFKNEVIDFFYKACAYVHPSQRQIEEQLDNYESGNQIGFETTQMLSELNKIIFRAYDMILTMIFHGLGESMSRDLFEQILWDTKEWKFHRGKYIKEYEKKLKY